MLIPSAEALRHPQSSAAPLEIRGYILGRAGVDGVVRTPCQVYRRTGKHGVLRLRSGQAVRLRKAFTFVKASLRAG